MSFPARPLPRARSVLGLAMVLSLAATALGAIPAAQPVAVSAAAPPTFYVDGKTGDDGNDGTSLGSAFRTIEAGLWALRYGGTLNVKGYDDHVYYERMSGSQWFINGTPSTPVVIQALGYGGGGATRPIVSGAEVVSRPGDGVWTRPDPTNHPDVWRTAWTKPIPGYESNVTEFRQERVFVDTSVPLVRPKKTPSLADLQALPGSQYWNGSHLYVRLGGWGSDLSDSLDPNEHLVEIPTYSGLLVASGSAYVEIRGFRVRHTTMGVGFTGSSHHNTAVDVDASYNYTMGFWTGGDDHTFRRISGTRNTLQLVKLDNGAQRNVVEDAVAVENMGQGIKLTGASTSYNTVRDSVFRGGRDVPMSHGQYGGYVQGIDIEQGAHHNTIIGNTIENNRRGLMLYQVTSSGQPLIGNQVRYNLFLDNDNAVVLWDGKYNATQGTGKVTFYRNTYVGNTKAITSESFTKRKRFDNETFYRTGSVKAVSHSAIYLKAGRIKVIDSIFRKTKGYVFFAKPGARIKVLYTAYRGTGLGARNSSARVIFKRDVRNVNPRLLSYDPVSAVYLTIDATSPVYRFSSTDGPVGARWR